VDEDVHLGVMVWPGAVLMCPSRSSKELERLERALTEQRPHKAEKRCAERSDLRWRRAGSRSWRGRHASPRGGGR
jgi:hypothetical protein